MITRVAGVRVGHYTDLEGLTGCTVILVPPGTVGSGTVIGGAPGTREIDLLDPSRLVGEVHAFLLAGGSAFGLAAADGVMAALEERGVGVRFGGATVPIVPAAVLFDLGIGDAAARPGAEAGYASVQAASPQVEEGSVGAGTGATVGKWAGARHAMRGGLGSASVALGDAGVIVGAVVACNAAGDVLDERGEVLAGARTDAAPAWAGLTGQSTVLTAVVTNAQLDKAGAAHVARMATAGIARAVRPAHTPYDGDVVLVAATGEHEAERAVVGAVAAEVVAAALRRGVRAAVGRGGVPGLAGGT